MSKKAENLLLILAATLLILTPILDVRITIGLGVASLLGFYIYNLVWTWKSHGKTKEEAHSRPTSSEEKEAKGVHDRFHE